MPFQPKWEIVCQPVLVRPRLSIQLAVLIKYCWCEVLYRLLCACSIDSSYQLGKFIVGEELICKLWLFWNPIFKAVKYLIRHTPLSIYLIIVNNRNTFSRYEYPWYIGYSPLHTTCCCGQLDTVKFLMSTIQTSAVGTGPSPTWQSNTNYNFFLNIIYQQVLIIMYHCLFVWMKTFTSEDLLYVYKTYENIKLYWHVSFYNIVIVIYYNSKTKGF